MKICISGHRPLKKYFKNPAREELLFIESLDAYLQTIEKEYTFILGGACGVDHWGAKYCLANNIPFELHVPFPLRVHTKGWLKEDKFFLLEQHKKATKVKVLSELYNTQAYQRRNESMVDASDLLLTWYTHSKSGSGNCVRYAKKTNIKIVHLKKWRKGQSLISPLV